MNFKYETIKYKIKKGDHGFGIALGGGGHKKNDVTGETGIFISDVLPGPAFGNLVVGDIIIKINGIDMTKAEKPQATTLLKGSSVAELLIKRRVSLAYGHSMQHVAPPNMVHEQNYVSDVHTLPPQSSVYASQYNQAYDDPNTQMANLMKQNMAKNHARFDSDSDYEYRSKSKHGKHYDSRSSSYEKKKHKKSSRKKYSSSEKSSSRGSSLDRELSSIKIRDDYVTIPVKAHEPKKVILRKKLGESFGMKLGTRVFVQGLTKDGLADKEGLNTEDLILSINGTETDSMTIPEVLAQLVNVDSVELEVQQVTGGTVTLPSDVLNSTSRDGSKTSRDDSKSNSKSSKSDHKRRNHHKKKRRSGSEDYHRTHSKDSRHNSRHHSRHDSRHDLRNESRYDSHSNVHQEAYVSQKSTHV